MNDSMRLLDANINRAAEGIRVLEDIARFSYQDEDLCKQLKTLRHQVRKQAGDMIKDALFYRDSARDVGAAVSKTLQMDQKGSVQELIAANFKRAQEALRVSEEMLRVLSQYQLAKQYEQMRFSLYTLEKEFNVLAVRRQKVDNIRKSGLYGLTASEYSLGRDNIEVVQSMLDAGISIIQYREKEMSKRQKYEECLKIREITREAGAILIVNDDIDLCILSEADGLHIGQEDLPLTVARSLLPPQMIIGLSTHSTQQAQEAQKLGADYIGVGPIYKTATKKNVVDPVGLSYLSYVAREIDLPYVAIGGIKEHNIQDVIQNGGRCIALVTEITGASDIPAKIKTLQKILQETAKPARWKGN